MSRRINVRLDIDGGDELYSALVALAKRNNRSLNSEAITALQHYVAQEIRMRVALNLDREAGISEDDL
jgi:predicted HicB family RNase H-like nuclease